VPQPHRFVIARQEGKVLRLKKVLYGRAKPLEHGTHALTPC
jgi:hypothetical protein